MLVGEGIGTWIDLKIFLIFKDEMEISFKCDSKIWVKLDGDHLCMCFGENKSIYHSIKGDTNCNLFE
jgi:hypothetical protein